MENLDAMMVKLAPLASQASSAFLLRQVLLGDEKLAEDVDLSSVASRTDGYSGSDLRQICTAAAMRPVRDLLKATGKSAQLEVTCLLKHS